MKPISDGARAYIESKGHLYLTADESWREQYYAQWQSDHNFDNDNSGHHEADCWDAHYSEEIAPYKRIDTGELVFEPTVRQKVKNAAIGLLVAGFTAGFFLAAVLFSNEEVGAAVRRLI